jgi:hypothetical protein
VKGENKLLFYNGVFMRNGAKTEIDVSFFDKK